jgi:hypothetical protein
MWKVLSATLAVFLFHLNLLLPLLENREEKHIQQTRNKDKVKMLFMIGLGVGEDTGEPKVEIRRQVCQH